MVVVVVDLVHHWWHLIVTLRNMFSPAVLTSKAAQKDFNKIKGIHADLLQGLAIQQQKVAMYDQQKAAEMATENTMKADMDKSRMAAGSADMKTALDFATKQSEIDIKRSALASE